MEGEAKCRVRVGGASHDRTVGNLCWAEFVHFSARPVDGECDPSLHAHMVVLNATFDKVEGQWKAGQFRDLKADAPYWQAAFHARLAGKLEITRFSDDLPQSSSDDRVVVSDGDPDHALRPPGP